MFERIINFIAGNAFTFLSILLSGIFGYSLLKLEEERSIFSLGWGFVVFLVVASCFSSILILQWGKRYDDDVEQLKGMMVLALVKVSCWILMIVSLGKGIELIVLEIILMLNSIQWVYNRYVK